MITVKKTEDGNYTMKMTPRQLSMTIGAVLEATQDQGIPTRIRGELEEIAKESVVGCVSITTTDHYINHLRKNPIYENL